MTLVSLYAVCVLMAPVAFGSLSEALEAAREGEPVDGRVSVEIGREAAEVIALASDDETVRAAVRVAVEGASDEVPGALTAHVEVGGGGTGAALIALSRLEPTRRGACARSTAVVLAATSVVVDAHYDEEVRCAAARLLAWSEDVEEIGRLARALSEEPSGVILVGLLEDLALADRGGDDAARLLETLAGVDPPGRAADDALRQALAGLARHPPAATLLLDALERGDTGTRDCLLHAVGAVPHDHWERALALVRSLVWTLDDVNLSDVDTTWLTGVITSAEALLVADVVPHLTGLAVHGPRTSVRIASIRALVSLARSDGPTVDLLLRLARDPVPEVSMAAFEGLRRKSGQTLPARLELWEKWRVSRNDLTSSGEETDATVIRLERERSLRLRMARRRGRSS